MWYHYISKGSTAIMKQEWKYPDSLPWRLPKGALSHTCGRWDRREYLLGALGEVSAFLIKRTGKRGEVSCSLLLPSSHLVLNGDAWSLTKQALRHNAKVSQVKNKEESPYIWAAESTPADSYYVRKINYLLKPLRVGCLFRRASYVTDACLFRKNEGKAGE